MISTHCTYNIRISPTGIAAARPITIPPPRPHHLGSSTPPTIKQNMSQSKRHSICNISQEFICFDCTQTREMLHYGLHNKLKTVQRLRQTPARICSGRSRCKKMLKKMLNMWQFAISNGDQPICKRRLFVLDRRLIKPRFAPNAAH